VRGTVIATTGLIYDGVTVSPDESTAQVEENSHNSAYTEHKLAGPR
jgi:hypothetical protein